MRELVAIGAIRFLLAAGAVLTFAAPAHATPSILGTYSGSGTDSESGCITPPFMDSGTFGISLTIGSQQGSSFAGTGTTTSDDGGAEPFTIDGSILEGGSVNGNWTSTDEDDDQAAGTFTGNLAGDRLAVNFSGADIGGPMCNISGSFTVTRGAIDPRVTSGTGAITPTVFFATVGTTPSLTSTRLRVVFKSMLAAGESVGVVPVADGFMLQGDTGMAAGDGSTYPWGAWASYSHSDYEDDFVSTKFDADRDNVTVGLDFSPWDTIVAGVSLGYENNDIDTTFNGGNMDSDMITVAPYIGTLINDTFSVDFSIGYSNIDVDQFRTFAGTKITSSVDSERWFVAGNLNAGRDYGNWYLSGTAGLLYASEEQDAFVESDGTANPDRSFELGQLRVGGDVSYRWGSFEPFASAVYELDYSRDDIIVAAGIPQPANDDDDVLVGAGLRWFSANGLSASVHWSSVLGREDFDDDTYNLLIRADF